MKGLRFTTTSATQTQQLGQQIGALLQPPVLIALNGDLGAGKTTLTQGIAAGLGVTQRVTSPTFTLVNEYPLANGMRLVHIDSYRLAAGEAEGIGLDEILDDERAIVIIEWAERVIELLPKKRIEIQLSSEDEIEKRKVSVTASGDREEVVASNLAALMQKQQLIAPD